MPAAGSGARWILCTSPAGLCARSNASEALLVLVVSSGALFKILTAGAGGTAVAIVAVDGSLGRPGIGWDAAHGCGGSEKVPSRAR